MLKALCVIDSKRVKPSTEAFNKENRTINDSPLQSSIRSIENTSLESVEAYNKPIVEEEVKQIEKNRESGAMREEYALKDLQDEFSAEEGYKIEREQCLRNEKGESVKDPETGEARRIDFIVTKDEKVVKSIEVTSESAPKAAQLAKEDRIRDVGGNFIKDRNTGQLVEMASNVRTEVRRYP